MVAKFGHIVSEATKEKLRIAMIGKYIGRRLSDEQKAKISESKKGKKLSESHKKSLVIAWKKRKINGKGIAWNKGLKGICRPSSGSFKKGRIPWNKGKEYLKIKGKKHHNWKGGITPIRIKERQNIIGEKWRKSVFERDNYTCQSCKRKNGNGKTIHLEAHHLYSFSEYPNLRYELWNGQTLCDLCHLHLHKELGFEG